MPENYYIAARRRESQQNFSLVYQQKGSNCASGLSGNRGINFVYDEQKAKEVKRNLEKIGFEALLITAPSQTSLGLTELVWRAERKRQPEERQNFKKN